MHSIFPLSEAFKLKSTPIPAVVVFTGLIAIIGKQLNAELPELRKELNLRLVLEKSIWPQAKLAS